MLSDQNIQQRSITETSKILNCISEGQKMMELGDDVDKTPASVTKYKSGKGSCYSLNLN